MSKHSSLAICKTVLLGGVVGGMLMFIWSAVSWTMLPWHETSLRSFTHEALVAEVIRTNAPADGLYFFPFAKTPEAVEAAAGRPYGLLVYHQAYDPSMKRPMIVAWLTQMIGAALMTGLLLCARLRGYWQRVSFVVGMAAVGGVLCYVPDWNWWGYPGTFTLVAIADLLIAAFLAGLVIAAFTTPRS